MPRGAPHGCIACISFLAFSLPGLLLLSIPYYCWVTQGLQEARYENNTAWLGRWLKDTARNPQRGLMGNLRRTGSMESPEKVEVRNVDKKRRQSAFDEQHLSSFLVMCNLTNAFLQSVSPPPLSFIALSILNISLYRYLLICILTVSPSRT